jgi:hypothetical protein
MKKFLLRSAGFVAFFIVFFALLNTLFLVVITSASWSFKNRLESLQFEDPDYDLLVLGASTTGDGVDTKFLGDNGIKSYNMAIGGSSPLTSYIQLEEYLSMYSHKPKYVIMGVNSTMEWDFDREGIHPIIEVTMEGHKFGIEDIPISKFRWLGFEVFKRLINKDHRTAKLVEGQLRIKKQVKDRTRFIDQELDLQLFESSYWLGEIARLCDENELELFIVEMPGYRETQNLSEFGPYPIYYENGSSALVCNFNTREIVEGIDPDLDWVGNSHLNLYGAEKFTSMLLESLQVYLDK